MVPFVSTTMTRSQQVGAEAVGTVGRALTRAAGPGRAGRAAGSSHGGAAAAIQAHLPGGCNVPAHGARNVPAERGRSGMAERTGLRPERGA